MDSCENDELLGLIRYRQNGRIRRYAIRVTADAIIVQYPESGSMEVAKTFFRKNREWVESVLKRRKKKNTVVFDEETVFRTQTFTLVIKASEGQRYCGKFDRAQGVFTIFYPSKDDVRSVESQETIKKILKNALTIEAKRCLPDRLRELAQRYGFCYNDCKIRMMRSRWGSCSNKGSIHLSSLLMALPVELSDFVMLHELCHTLEMNHGERFYSHLNRVVENRERELNLLLKECGRKPHLSLLFS